MLANQLLKKSSWTSQCFFLLRMRHGLKIFRVTESLAQSPNVSESHDWKTGSRRGASAGSATSAHILTDGWLFSASDMSVCERGRSLHCESLLGNSQEWAKRKVLMETYNGLHGTGEIAQGLRYCLTHIALPEKENLTPSILSHQAAHDHL